MAPGGGAVAAVRRQASPRSFAGRFALALVLTVAIVVAGIGAVYSYAARKVEKVPTVAIDPAVLSEGGNYLLVGSDSRSFVADEADADRFGSAGAQGGQRSDTIMVAHVDGRKGTGFLVSFPRDLWVDIPGMGEAKINAAFNGGPQRLIETIEKNFDIPISHYLEVDFAGFRSIVDTIGTVPVWFPTPARDQYSGLDIPEAGCHRLDGEQALSYVRSRYYESFENGKWRTDPLSDLSRIERQQAFLRTLMLEVTATAERKPWDAPDVLDAMLANVQRDPELGLGAFRALAYGFRSPGGGIETMTIPATPRQISGQAALVVDDEAAAPILARLRGAGDTDERAAPGDVRVAVRNGSGRTGVAATTAGALRAAGFVVAGEPGNADRSDYATTEIRYASGSEAKARAVQAALGGAGRLVVTDAPADADVVLVLGRDGATVGAPSATVPSDTAPSDTAPSDTAGDAAPEPAAPSPGGPC